MIYCVNKQIQPVLGPCNPFFVHTSPRVNVIAIFSEILTKKQIPPARLVRPRRKEKNQNGRLSATIYFHIADIW